MGVSSYDVASGKWEDYPPIPAQVGIQDPFMVSMGGQLMIIDETNVTSIVFIDTSAARSTVGYPWSIATVFDGPSPARYGMRFVAWGALIYFFGGVEISTGVMHNDMWALPAGQVITGYSLPYPSWSQVAQDSLAGFPPPRVGYTLTAFGTVMVMFGGVSLLTSAPPGTLPEICFTPASATFCQFHSDVWLFTPGNPGPPGEITVLPSQWKALAPGGAAGPPTGRFDHVAGAISDQLFVYGGTTSTGGVSELWVYNILTQSWAQISPSFPAPDTSGSDVGYGVGLVLGRHLYRFAQNVDKFGEPVSGSGELWRWAPVAISPPSSSPCASPASVTSTGLTAAVTLALLVGLANLALLLALARHSSLLDFPSLTSCLSVWRGSAPPPASAAFYSNMEDQAH